ncbi:hypothetical protein [uncultured Desulfovibrio sp.]|uniref:hypothetical protein n=1 Tax=uncultured Desulfovibrio sp. TaxID=167968 RepID=UPI002616E7AC|nr:hypothetical protein [uncultured Desulfovibrio sp.]
MTEKIEWYKEVLELEPNSKVFFPLARMLANEGETEEAIEIIERGLVRHPEFLEARLYCIELLHKCGRIDACQPHVERLSKMLSAYGEFWRAWASCIAAMKESGSEDTASALRFLAANFLHGPISLSKIIEEGLAAVLGENKDASLAASLNLDGNKAAQLQTAAPANEAEPAAVQETAPVAAAAAVATGAALGVAAATADSSDIEEAAQPAAPADDDLLNLDMTAAAPADDAFPAVEEAAQPAAPADDDLLNLDLTAAAPADDAFPAVEEAAQPAAPADDDLLNLDLTAAAPADDAFPAVEEAAPAAGNDAAAEMNEADALLTDEALFAEATSPAGAGDDMFADMEEEAALADLDATLAAEGLPETEAPLLPDTDNDAAVDLAAGLDLDLPAESEPEEEAPQQETFSIRTRSMAEVLAEQGDIQGALEIYQELAQSADGPEKDELSQRIVTLQARLGGAVPTPAVEEAPAKAPTGKEQVLSVLTSLAKGLESRAH